MTPSTALLAGFAAGLAVAVPLGPLGLLLLDRGMLRGLHQGLPAALAIGTVDAVYAALAVTVGAAATPLVQTVRGPGLAAAGLVLLGLGGHALLTTIPTKGARTPTTLPARATAPTGRSGVTFGAFAGLTALNPTTLLTFTAIAVATGDRVATPTARAAFVLGVAAASWSWQVGLVALGAVLGRRPRPRLVTLTRMVGAVGLALLGIGLLLDATT